MTDKRPRIPADLATRLDKIRRAGTSREIPFERFVSNILNLYAKATEGNSRNLLIELSWDGADPYDLLTWLFFADPYNCDVKRWERDIARVRDEHERHEREQAKEDAHGV